MQKTQNPRGAISYFCGYLTVKPFIDFSIDAYADELFEIHNGCVEQIEAHLESAGFSDEDIFVQLRRLELSRVYVREYFS